MSDVSWQLVLSLGATGIVMALVSCFVGLRPKVENPAWWGLYAVWIAIVLALGDATPFRTVLFASIVAGGLHGVTTSLCIDRYIVSNPWHAERMQAPKSKLRLMFCATGLLVGTVFGAVVAGIAWGLARI